MLRPTEARQNRLSKIISPAMNSDSHELPRVAALDSASALAIGFVRDIAVLASRARRVGSAPGLATQDLHRALDGNGLFRFLGLLQTVFLRESGVASARRSQGTRLGNARICVAWIPSASVR